MMMAELIAKLENQFPGSPVAAWADDYKRVLKPFAGPALDHAWAAFIKTWDKGFAPKPAELLKFCKHIRPRGTERHVEGREAWAMVDRRCDEMVDDWFRDHPDVGNECQRNIPLLGLVRDRLRKIAFIAAQKEVLGSANPHGQALEYFGFTDWLPDEELQRMCNLVEVWGNAPQSKEFKRPSELVAGAA